MVVAIVIAALAIGLVVQRMILSSPQATTPYQARLDAIENQGFTPQEANKIASANVTILDSNSSHEDLTVYIPSGPTSGVSIDVLENDSFTSAPGEIDNASLGVCDMNFRAENTTSEEISI